MAGPLDVIPDQRWAVIRRAWWRGSEGKWFVCPGTVARTRRDAIDKWDEMMGAGDYARMRRRGEAKAVRVVVTLAPSGTVPGEE